MDLPKVEHLIHEMDPEYIQELYRSLLRQGYGTKNLMPQQGRFMVRSREGRVIITSEAFTSILEESDSGMHILRLETVIGGGKRLYRSHKQSDVKGAEAYLWECWRNGEVADIQEWHRKQRQRPPED